MDPTLQVAQASSQYQVSYPTDWEQRSYTEQVQWWVDIYADNGYAPTPLSAAVDTNTGTNGKAPCMPSWATVKVLDRGEWGVGDRGVGLVMGRMGIRGNGTLVCIDIDSQEALQFEKGWLPETHLIGGRTKKPRSNRFYIVTDKAESSLKRISAAGDTHVEILGGSHQMAVEPTIIIDKQGRSEGKQWYEYGPPGYITWKEAEEAITKLAVVSELSRVWPKGGRHNLSLPLAGGLIRAGWSDEEVERIINILGWETQEEGEIWNLLSSTRGKLERDEGRVTGWPTVQKILGEGEDGKVGATIARILQWLKADTDDRPGVEVRAGGLDHTIKRAWSVLASSNDPVSLMRFSNTPIRIEKVDDRESSCITVPLNSDRLRYHVAETMTFYRRTEGKDGESGSRRPLDPPKDVIIGMLASYTCPLPVLSRIVTAPVFSPDGKIQTDAGYHPDSKVFYVPTKGVSLESIPASPNTKDVARAKNMLLTELLGDFAFEGETDRAHALAYIILPFVRDMIDGPTPLHILDANSQAAGKTLLAGVGSSIFIGTHQGAIPCPYPTQEDEMVKLLLSNLNEGRSHNFFDNVTSKISSASFAMALTADTFAARRLGSTETLYPPIRCVWVLTSNNARGDSDIIRRSIRSRLVSDKEHPHLIAVDHWRHFPLREWTMANRGELIWGVLTLIQNWVNSGVRRGTIPFGDYGDWSGVMGGILECAEVEGFLQNVVSFQTMMNEEKEAWEEVYVEMWRRYGGKVWATGDALAVGQGAGLLIRGRDFDDQKRELGSMLRGKHQVIHSGLRLHMEEKIARRGAGRGYRLEPLEGQSWSGPDSSVTMGKILTIPGMDGNYGSG